ncbi:MAG: hypothetical protein KDE46_00330 [Caldilineaceae bacterium]|nr:hypothetical protein [Caldilineaceae bacterium]
MPQTKKSKGPALRTPLVGHAARICESLMLCQALTVAQLQALHLPCEETVETVGEKAFEKHRRSKLETVRQIMEKLVTHGYVQRTRVSQEWLYGAVRERAVVDVAAYYQRQFQKEFGDQAPAELAWKADAQSLAQGYEWSPYCKIMTWGSSTLKHHIKDMDAHIVLTLACDLAGVTQELWLPEHIIKRLHKGLKVSYAGPDGNTYESQLRPDDWYIFSKQVGNELIREKFLLEVDNGSQVQSNVSTRNKKKQKRSMAHKFRAYHCFMKRDFRRLYGFANAKIIILTSGERRMWNLKTLCEESGGKGRYWFTHKDLFTPANIFCQPIFVRAGDPEGEYVALFSNGGKS